ncbi:metal-dependent protein hydrolase [Mycotypha africana]|uniref:metal-dependent protein hydrolase n=1 Tax=Mycotypha africana TaxID=64632 RepID=UPI002301DB20|nr:metal-dependent protein hydrolase [Mycotypha africana]KAI8981801.1 metal-dependent protein hydrolase [Mycotypha africana]
MRILIHTFCASFHVMNTSQSCSIETCHGPRSPYHPKIYISSIYAAPESVFLISAYKKTIGTHSGHFHCDEALAVSLLKRTKEFANANLVRTRDPAKLAECDIVVDVGGVYDPAIHRYDHHQRGFTETFTEAHKTKLSSAGLVYKHFGKEVIMSILGKTEEDNDVDLIYKRTYDGFVEALDANDNGISAYPSNVTPLYKESPTSIYHRVARMNPLWSQPLSDAEIDARFVQASDMAGAEFVDFVKGLQLAWLPARSLVVDALERATEIHSSGRVIALQTCCPWKEHLMDLEKERGLDNPEKNILYVLYPEKAEENCNWRIQCVPVRSEGFENRKSLPEAWRGFRDEELSKISGVNGCIFVHAAGFIGGNKTRDGIYEMARLALEM